MRKRPGLWPTDVRRRGVTSSFEWAKAKEELGYDAPITQADGMRELARWVERMGGPAEVAKLARPVPGRADITAQVELARQERSAAPVQRDQLN
jgi:hypothetical protein